MRRILIVAFFVVALTLCAQEIIDTNSAVVAWDAVTTLTDGSPVPAEDTIEYELFIAPRGDRDNKVEIGRTPDLTFTITFTDEGVYDIGVRAVRIYQGTSEMRSTITWSEDETNPFLIRYIRAPEAPTSLRVP